MATKLDPKLQVTFLLFCLELHTLSDACGHAVRTLKDPHKERT